MGGNNCNTNNNNQMQMGPMSNNMRFPGNMPISAIPGLGQNILFNLSHYTQSTMNRAPNMLMQNPISTPLNVPTGQMNMSLAAQRLMQPGMMMQPGNNFNFTYYLFSFYIFRLTNVRCRRGSNSSSESKFFQCSPGRRTIE